MRWSGHRTEPKPHASFLSCAGPDLLHPTGGTSLWWHGATMPTPDGGLGCQTEGNQREISHIPPGEILRTLAIRLIGIQISPWFYYDSWKMVMIINQGNFDHKRQETFPSNCVLPCHYPRKEHFRYHGSLAQYVH